MKNGNERSLSVFFQDLGIACLISFLLDLVFCYQRVRGIAGGCLNVCQPIENMNFRIHFSAC